MCDLNGSRICCLQHKVHLPYGANLGMLFGHHTKRQRVGGMGGLQKHIPTQNRWGWRTGNFQLFHRGEEGRLSGRSLLLPHLMTESLGRLCTCCRGRGLPWPVRPRLLPGWVLNRGGMWLWPFRDLKLGGSRGSLSEGLSRCRRRRRRTFQGRQSWRASFSIFFNWHVQNVLFLPVWFVRLSHLALSCTTIIPSNLPVAWTARGGKCL